MQTIQTIHMKHAKYANIDSLHVIQSSMTVFKFNFDYSVSVFKKNYNLF
jgi:hypothetical protein